jgi:hypothetical protein
MAYTRDDFLAKFAAIITNFPALALYYQAGDPTLLAPMGAVATMFGMLSEQLDIAMLEPFSKTRDTTVLADAAMKGILPFAIPPTMTITATNPGTVSVPITAGRRLLDQNGRVYTAQTNATVPAGGTATLLVKQMTTRAESATVDQSAPFYAVQIPENSDADQCVSGVYVSVDGAQYYYAPEFANVAADDPAFDIVTDEQRRLFVKFGWANTFGTQPDAGATVSLLIEETLGATDLATNAAFTLEATTTTADRALTFKLASVVNPGADPVDIEVLRQLATYPSGYDGSAVYLGNFDFLIRRNLLNLRFLSVWNEQVEESVRGPNVQNINRQFIAVLSDGATTADQIAALQKSIRNVVAAADDSYWVKFVDAVETPLPLTINAQVSVVHDTGDVEAQIRAQVLALYGRDAAAVRQGMIRLSNKKITDALKKNIVALQDDGSDFQITLPAQTNLLPEQFRYVSDASLTVNVTQATYNDGQWSH